MVAAKSGVALVADDASAALAMMCSLPAYPDVAPALQRLKHKGLRLATLSNSSPSGLQAQMEHAGLAGLFEQQLSVESMGKFKPHPDVYAWAARQMGRLAHRFHRPARAAEVSARARAGDRRS